MEKDHVAILFSTISLFEIIASLASGPVLMGLFKTGIGLGGIWAGLPFIVLGCMLGLVALAAYCLRLPTQLSQGEHRGEDEDEDGVAS